MTMSQSLHRAYFEDIKIGESVETPAMTLTEAHVSLYRGLTDDQGGPSSGVPDLLPLCLSTGLGWRLNRAPLAVLAFMSVDWHIERPLQAGDTIRGRARAVAKRSLREGGVLMEEHEIVNQHGEAVQHGRFTFLVAKRPPSSS
ncbi:MAG: MaoC family dehydratase [Candidatus Rokuibacteriota bacterium]